MKMKGTQFWLGGGGRGRNFNKPIIKVHMPQGFPSSLNGRQFLTTRYLSKVTHILS